MILGEGGKGNFRLTDGLEHGETSLAQRNVENEVYEPGLFFNNMLKGESSLDESGKGCHLVVAA